MKILFLLGMTMATQTLLSQPLYQMPAKTESKLSSFENPNGIKGSGGKTNNGSKGNAFEWVKAGETKTLLDTKSEGIIQRIWLTIDQNPVKLRSLRLQFFWDGETKPAVDVPLGDFFCYNLGRQVKFESVFFSSGEGRSFMCYIPMPFHKGAKILLTNEGGETAKLYYDVDFTTQSVPATALYFHAHWVRQMKGELGDDFDILPKLNGKGRFLGMSVGLNTDSAYEKSWWGEGEVKMYIDGDTKYPTIVGTGSEDYIGSAWGLGTFINQYQGCTIANDSTRQFSFYRWHIPDAVYFEHDIKVAIQQIGGWGKNQVRDLYRKGVNLKPVSVDGNGKFIRLMEDKTVPAITDEKFPDGWVNFYRVDDYSAVSYFYLDKPVNGLPALAPVEVRLKNVK